MRQGDPKRAPTINNPGRYYKKILEDELIDTWDEDFLHYWEITRFQAEDWTERETDIDLLLEDETEIKYLVFLLYIGRPIPIKDIEWLQHIVGLLEEDFRQNVEPKLREEEAGLPLDSDN